MSFTLPVMLNVNLKVRLEELKMSALITAIDMLAATVATFAFLIVIAKFVTKRIKNKSADRFLMKIHRKAANVLIVTGFVHLVLSFRVLSTTPIIVYILGFICLLAILAASATFIFKKKLGNKWKILHNITTVIALVTLVLHLALID